MYLNTSKLNEKEKCLYYKPRIWAKKGQTINLKIKLCLLPCERQIKQNLIEVYKLASAEITVDKQPFLLVFFFRGLGLDSKNPMCPWAHPGSWGKTGASTGASRAKSRAGLSDADWSSHWGPRGAKDRQSQTTCGPLGFFVEKGQMAQGGQHLGHYFLADRLLRMRITAQHRQNVNTMRQLQTRNGVF